ncbi:hypothetical protein HL653_21100 [Sphingomonas sp. AP4-R1]|uniref:ankyrin repeat domain-containing protein n=1 Tax=Sphingomonas sp. AP4-R1 TaxID=2735134 RepID=UPI001493CBBD|nr:ankyrin repeat domain-containing protein [Sphingomonas sp. AP4-R1]QJU59908.1 hypothetical protein HL653_21100 [Sphingomonas sp. AP4-R1]
MMRIDRILAVTLTLISTNAMAGCFVAGTTPPTQDEIALDAGLGQSGRDLALALLGRDWARAESLIARDPALGRLRVGAHHDMLSVAVASCDARAIALLARHGAPMDGTVPGVALGLALRATAPDLAFGLLEAGASPEPKGDAAGPMATAIALNSIGAVRLLLDHKADPNRMEATGNRPLQSALDMEHFRIAELLLDRGADPWAIDAGGGNLGSALDAPMLTRSAEEEAARARLRGRRKTLRWPVPAPDPARVRALALAGEWPPAAARAKGAKPVPEAVLALIRRRAERAK